MGEDNQQQNGAGMAEAMQNEMNGGTSNEALMKQIVDLQQQMVNQQKKSAEDVGEKRVNKYAVLLIIFGGILLLWFFGAVVYLAHASASRWLKGDFLVHDHILMPATAVLLILAAVQLMTKKRMAKIMVGVGLGVGLLWNIVAAVHGFIAEASGNALLSTGNSGVAITLALTRVLIYGLVFGGLALWFYKSRSIQDTISKWV